MGESGEGMRGFPDRRERAADRLFGWWIEATGEW
jgi:hypothetical protein